jgi:hypothetical protein
LKIIRLTQNELAFVDDEDFEFLSSYRWSPVRSRNLVYAITNVRTAIVRTTMEMQRLILPSADMIDHINQNGLDNQRHNLRAATPTQNQHNRRPNYNSNVPYKGVDYIKRKNRFRARITVDGATLTIGASFKTAEDAARAYNEQALKYFGEFAHLNMC